MRLRASLRADLEFLVEDIGPRNAWRYKALKQTVDFLERELEAIGCRVERQTYALRGQEFHNLEVEMRGSRAPGRIVLFGAHYDTVAVPGCAGANDNGSGVVALLALVRALARTEPELTLRFVFFVNEEPPFFPGPEMGSRVYARRSRSRAEDIVAMFSLETIGYYSERPGSQRYPPLVRWFYPDRGNFLAFVGNLSSRSLVNRAVAAFQRGTSLPAEGAGLPGWLPGISWSDHASFWKEGFPALMVTDTAPYRYPHYHTAQDTLDKIDFDGLTRAVVGLVEVARDFGRA